MVYISDQELTCRPLFKLQVFCETAVQWPAATTSNNTNDNILPRPTKNNMGVGCLRYFCIIVVFYSCFKLSSGKLYFTKDPIVLLENDTIAETIYNSPVSWIVEFYSSWCGHCHAFAPTWKKMAHVVKGKVV